MEMPLRFSVSLLIVDWLCTVGSVGCILVFKALHWLKRNTWYVLIILGRSEACAVTSLPVMRSFLLWKVAGIVHASMIKSQCLFKQTKYEKDLKPQTVLVMPGARFWHPKFAWLPWNRGASAISKSSWSLPAAAAHWLWLVKERRRPTHFQFLGEDGEKGSQLIESQSFYACCSWSSNAWIWLSQDCHVRFLNREDHRIRVTRQVYLKEKESALQCSDIIQVCKT